jgi:hypothetical protein
VSPGDSAYSRRSLHGLHRRYRKTGESLDSSHARTLRLSRCALRSLAPADQGFGPACADLRAGKRCRLWTASAKMAWDLFAVSVF